MVSTVVLIVLFLVVLAVSFVLWAVFLRWGLQWAGVEGATWRHIIIATISFSAVQTALNVLFVWLEVSFPAWGALFAVLMLVGLVLAAGWIIAAVFHVGLARALKAWLPTLVPAVGMVVFALFVFRPFFYEAFFSPTNAMAPTLLGSHLRGVCPVCGEPNYCSSPHGEYEADRPRAMICSRFHVGEFSSDGLPVIGPDRFLVAKFLCRCWDIVVFRYPVNPKVLYCMRLVGLPGERIEIKDGAVWADNKRLEPPAELDGIEYESAPPGLAMDVWGTPEMPAVLNDDEYFVLGDFSAQSADSRYWQHGAANHNPFAVPKANLNGVATHIYWPPIRWRVLR